jgi:hypothetical protein
MRRMRRPSRRPALLALVGASILVTGATLAETAHAETLIEQPGSHTDYRWELEPHLVFTPFRGGFFRDRWRGYESQVGLGFRASVEVADPAFVKTINDTVGISFGVDFTNCDWCRDDFAMVIPVVLQWNFWFTEEWSAFAEPGIAIRSAGFFDVVDPDLALAIGGRYQFNDDIGLTLRIGYPYVSFGVSFFL